MRGNAVQKTPTVQLQEDYTFRMELLQRVASMVETTKIWYDLFSNSLTASFPDYITSAWDIGWNEPGKIFRCNPPFTQWREVAIKVQASSSQFVCLIPDWGQNWISDLLQLSDRKCYLPARSCLFELDAKRVGPTRWGCWLLFIPEMPRKVGLGTEAFMNVEILPWNQVGQSRSGKRRERDKKVRARQLQ